MAAVLPMVFQLAGDVGCQWVAIEVGDDEALRKRKDLFTQAARAVGAVRAVRPGVGVAVGSTHCVGAGVVEQLVQPMQVSAQTRQGQNPTTYQRKDRWQLR